MNTEAEVLKWAGQAGGAGALMYALIRFGPLIEQLLTGRSRRDAMMTGPQGAPGANGKNGKTDDAHIDAQVYKVIRSEKMLDQDTHDRQCNYRQALVMQHIDSHTKALDKIGVNVDELLKRVKNGGP